MVNSFSQGKGHLVEPPYGSYVDSWQLPVNSNFGLTDALVSGTTTIDLSTLPSSTPFVTLVFANFDTTATPWNVPLAGQNLRISLTGNLSFPVTVYIPANNPGMWLIDNSTSGSQIVTVKTNALGSVGIQPPQGYVSSVFCDGTNVKWADQGNVIANVPSSIPSGAMMPFAMATAPYGWLACNGAGVSRSIYSSLFAAIGTTWGSGDGSTTFNLPNINQGAFLRGIGGNAAALGTLQTDDFKSHTHTDAGHTHFGNIYNSYLQWNTTASPADQVAFCKQSASNWTPVDTAIGKANIQNTGGTETRPLNYAVNYCIKT